MVVILSNRTTHSFSLNGAEVVSLSLNDEYKEEGAKAEYNGKDITDEVVIKYFINSKEGSEADKIDTSKEITYYAKYSINHEKLKKDLYRQINVTACSPISINFLELGNKNTGDATYIKAGDVDILIDAGSKRNSADTVCNFLNKEENVKDGVIEYLIVTHAHEDHIASLVGTDSKNNGVFDKFKINTIIQFSQTNSNTKVYQSFCDKRDNEVNEGAKLYYAKDLIENKNNKFDIAPGISFSILDQKYYHEKSSDENNYSVVTLFTQNQNNYLFTGDLELEGEESLVELNKDLPHCNLFKAGHHGSYTASNECLLSKITPDVICVCCCAGNDEYTDVKDNQFPAQATINRMAKYTEKIYVTTVTDENDGFKSMNGNIKYTSTNGKDFEIHGSNNDLILKESEWFKENRTWPEANKAYCSG